MKKYKISATVSYEIEAPNEDEAVFIFCDESIFEIDPSTIECEEVFDNN